MRNKENKYSEDIEKFFLSQQNKKKEKELKEKYGMTQMCVNEDAPPEIVNEFLKNVEEYEAAFEHAEQKKVIEILEYPVFVPLENLKPGSINNEIDRVLDIYTEHDINVDIIEKDEVTDEEFYKFLTEELAEHEMEYIPIKGMVSNFIYEEFHPSIKLDSKNAIEDFLYDSLLNEKDFMKTWLSNDQLIFNGQRKSLSEFIETMINFIPKNTIRHKIDFKSFEFGEQNLINVDLRIDFKKIPEDSSSIEQKVFHLLFEMQSSKYGGQEIISLNIE